MDGLPCTPAIIGICTFTQRMIVLIYGGIIDETMMIWAVRIVLAQIQKVHAIT